MDGFVPDCRGFVRQNQGFDISTCIRVSENRGHGNVATPSVNRSSVYSILRWRGEVETSKPWFWTQRNPIGPAQTHLSFGFLRDSAAPWCAFAFWLRLRRAAFQGLSPRRGVFRTACRRAGTIRLAKEKIARLHAHGPGEEVALHQIAAQAAQQIEFLGGFHALGHHAQAKLLSQSDDGPHDGAIAGFSVGKRVQVAYERLIALERVDR